MLIGFANPERSQKPKSTIGHIKTLLLAPLWACVLFEIDLLTVSTDTSPPPSYKTNFWWSSLFLWITRCCRLAQNLLSWIQFGEGQWSSNIRYQIVFYYLGQYGHTLIPRKPKLFYPVLIHASLDHFLVPNLSIVFSNNFIKTSLTTKANFSKCLIDIAYCLFSAEAALPSLREPVKHMCRSKIFVRWSRTVFSLVCLPKRVKGTTVVGHLVNTASNFCESQVCVLLVLLSITHNMNKIDFHEAFRQSTVNF